VARQASKTETSGEIGQDFFFLLSGLGALKDGRKLKQNYRNCFTPRGQTRSTPYPTLSYLPVRERFGGVSERIDSRW